VITRRRTKNLPQYLQDPNNRELLTSVKCVLANGQVIPLMVILLGKVISERDFLLGLLKDYIIAISETGYMNDNI
jgi:hypothetical protein